MSASVTPSKRINHWKIIEPVRIKIYIAMAISVLSVMFSLVSLMLMGLMVHNMMQPSPSVPWLILTSIIFLTLCSYFLRVASFQCSHLAAFELEPILRIKLGKHLSLISLGYITDTGSGALTKVIYDDIRELHAFVADSTPFYARAFAAPVITFILMIFLDWRFAFISFAVVFVGFGLISWAMRQNHQAGVLVKYNYAREQVNISIVEFIQAMSVVRAFDSSKTSYGRYQTALKNYLAILLDWYKSLGPMARYSMTILNPMPTLLILLWSGFYWFSQGTLDISTWICLLLIGTGMAEAIMPYMSLYHMIQKSKLGIARIEEVLQTPTLPITNDPQMPVTSTIEFKNVSFSYPNRHEKALDNISFFVPQGSFTALVGTSGAGKSTVARLIPRFWDINQGNIFIGGIDIREMSPETLMNQVSFVFQDNFLFSGTISENIALGMQTATKERIITAAKAAQCHDFICSLEQGYDTQVGERGTQLSGGQVQRITIARAILQNRPILVLDEATAHSDPENEALIMRALAALMKGKTVLVVAHRLGTTRHADQILVFDKGQLIESGTQKELLLKNGRYTQLWDAYQTAMNWKISTNETDCLDNVVEKS